MIQENRKNIGSTKFNDSTVRLYLGQWRIGDIFVFLLFYRWYHATWWFIEQHSHYCSGNHGSYISGDCSSVSSGIHQKAEGQR